MDMTLYLVRRLVPRVMVSLKFHLYLVALGTLALFRDSSRERRLNTAQECTMNDGMLCRRLCSCKSCVGLLVWMLPLDSIHGYSIARMMSVFQHPPFTKMPC